MGLVLVPRALVSETCARLLGAAVIGVTLVLLLLSQGRSRYFPRLDRWALGIDPVCLRDGTRMAVPDYVGATDGTAL